ncbi:uncharacterized protein LOC122247411 [Penaeus japonicus]|uniref:uncharacterized protein LOC122247411 n=1 Tax=Penaeus japonicus TaxID=27405 RepID=UPI001C7120DA|nr:uncharacterized protein LOC122247411 [Penaeus japonicus]
MNATLAVIKDASDLDGALMDKYYYTAHNFRGTEGVAPVMPDVTGFLSCTENCQVTPRTACVAVGRTGIYRLQSCIDKETPFICMYPGYCPAGYTLYSGHCYKVVSDKFRNVMQGFSRCLQEGSDLAYPEKMETFQFLNDLVKKFHGPTDSVLDVIIGISNIRSWSKRGIYTPNREFLNNLPGEKSYVLLTVNPGPSASFTARRIPYSINATLAVCKLHGLIDCWSQPRLLENATQTWSGEFKYNTLVTYKCNDGFHLNRKTDKVIQHSRCQSQLGDWGLPQKCVPDGCHADPPVAPAPDIVVTRSADFRDENGSVSYACPANMTTRAYESVQVVTCTKCAARFKFLPARVQDCDVCNAEPLVPNATTDWKATSVWSVGDTVTAKCLENHHLYAGEVTQTISCSVTGWEEAVGCQLIVGEFIRSS